MEVSDDFVGVVPVRDSKNSHSPAPVFPAGDWASFVSALRHSRLTA